MADVHAVCMCVCGGGGGGGGGGEGVRMLAVGVCALICKHISDDDMECCTSLYIGHRLIV